MASSPPRILRPSPVPCSKAPAGFPLCGTPNMAAGRMNACPGWVDGRAWTSMDEDPITRRGPMRLFGGACHGTLPTLLVKIKIKRAFLLCSLRSIYYHLQLVLYALASVMCLHVPNCLLVAVRRDAEAVCHISSRVMLCLNARLDSQLKWSFDSQSHCC